MTTDVVVVGSLHLDIMVHAPRLPRLGETLAGEHWSFKCGGKGGNQAVASALHGARTAMIGCVGNDDFGKRLRQYLDVHDVDHASVATHEAAPSGMSVAIERGDGEYAAVIVSGANLTIDDAMVDAADPMLKSASILLLQNEVAEAVNIVAASRAHCNGLIILNPAPVRNLPDSLLENVNILVANTVEAQDLTHQTVHDLATATLAAERLLDKVPAVIVTAGAAGVALATRGGQTVSFSAYPITAKSSHGAGDMFMGALAACLALGRDLASAVAYANIAAALYVAGSVSDRSTVECLFEVASENWRGR